MKYFLYSLSTLIFILMGITVQGQVKFKLQLLNDGETYQVSIVPETSYRPPMNITSTAQVTLKVPAGSFEVQNLINLQPNVEWDINSAAEAPDESREFDYLSFGLISNGTQFLRYESGIEIPIFTFENALPCSGDISLMDNFNDPFSPPNSASKNVGNQITIAGADGDAYTGNVTKTPITCGNLTTSIEEIDAASVQLKVFPNPAFEELTVSLVTNESLEDVTFALFDVLGRQLLTREMDLHQGENSVSMDISTLPEGAFFLELSNDSWKLNAGQFVKLLEK